MSSYIMHICVSNMVKRKLGLTDNFIYGSILPDVIKGLTGDRNKTHYLERVEVNRETRNLPNITRAIKEIELILQNTIHTQVKDIDKNIFMTRKSVDRYIQEQKKLKNSNQINGRVIWDI